jgi:hypothetical protein
MQVDPPTGSSPTRWKPTGMQSCADLAELKKATSARERPIGSASTKKSASASWRWPRTSPPCGAIPRPRRASASVCSPS